MSETPVEPGEQVEPATPAEEPAAPEVTTPEPSEEPSHGEESPA